ncbi:MAG: YwiC-like family protein [Candidatus Solibacter usitatus]|nr:YwiC-like family protein [Candidatus Solibacter usitatus]
MLPREHGAWSLLLTPFVAALLVAGRLNGEAALALAAVLAAFLVREPLIVLARQRWVWREQRAEAAVARKWLLIWGLAVAGSGGALVWRWGWREAGLMGAGAAALTGIAVWMTVNNRQRSAWLQVASCGGLTFSAVASARAVSGGFPQWAWILWGLCWLQGVAGILTVHTRLEALTGKKTGKTENRFRPQAWAAVGLMAGVAVGLAVKGAWLLAPAPGLAALAHGWELAAMRLETRLKVVGLRAMSLSIGYALLVVAALRMGG